MPASSSTVTPTEVSEDLDHEIPSSRNHLSLQNVAPGIAYLTTVFVNLYFVGEPGGPWVLVDTGLPHSAAFIQRAAAERFGPGKPPEAILLTHGHFDHSGSVIDLAAQWNVPIYAHPLEMPYLTGKSDYPPQDPTVGGAIAFLSRFFPHTGINIAGSVRPLPSDGTVPGLPGWRWYPTPGHTAGHVSLFRESDGVLLAGDAVTTMDLDSWSAQITERQELDGPPTPLTTDWAASKVSVELLSQLSPTVIAAGHGVPISGDRVGEYLRNLASQFTPPPHGRYVIQPAITDETGVVALPSPIPDTMPVYLAAASTVAGLALAAVYEKNRGVETGQVSATRSGKPQLKPLRDQVIVITGATSGIGLATARAASKAGARLVVAARDRDDVERLERELSVSGEALGVVCDVSSEEDVRELAARAIARFGGFDTWINNAGVSIYGKLEDVSRDDMRQLFETNYWGVVYGSLAALEHLKERGGAILNLGSALSERAIPLQGTYCASKFAVRGFTDALRMEIEKSGYPISLTLIKPSAIDTPYVQHAKNYLPHEPKNPAPVYAPDVVADVILHCAVHPERDRYAGGAGVGFGWMEKLLPRLTDRYMEATMFDQQQTEEPAHPRGSGSLYRPSGPSLAERGGYDGMVQNASPYDKAKNHRQTLGLLALGVGVLAAAVLLPRKPVY
jgi:NAD(P)-dependent dehydrogenase (short-subunit alcohol dehydrogenase family)/glyoxylase-like metal-dependent hydrolase (beta-lactamase superfamily II)